MFGDFDKDDWSDSYLFGMVELILQFCQLFFHIQLPTDEGLATLIQCIIAPAEGLE